MQDKWCNSCEKEKVQVEKEAEKMKRYVVELAAKQSLQRIGLEIESPLGTNAVNVNSC